MHNKRILSHEFRIRVFWSNPYTILVIGSNSFNRWLILILSVFSRIRNSGGEPRAKFGLILQKISPKINFIRPAYGLKRIQNWRKREKEKKKYPRIQLGQGSPTVLDESYIQGYILFHPHFWNSFYRTKTGRQSKSQKIAFILTSLFSFFPNSFIFPLHPPPPHTLL